MSAFGALGGLSREVARQGGIGKSTGSGGNNPGSQAAKKAKQGNQPAGVQTQGEGTVTGRQAAAADPGKVVSEPISANPNNPRTQNLERSASDYTGEGATPYIADPSLGQVFGALMTAAPIAGTANNVMGVANNLADGTTSFSSPYDGGAIGQAIDKFRGVKPGPVTGASNPDAARGNKGRGTIQPVAAGYGRVEDVNQPSLADAFSKIISAPGVWPPVRASAGI